MCVCACVRVCDIKSGYQSKTRSCVRPLAHNTHQGLTMVPRRNIIRSILSLSKAVYQMWCDHQSAKEAGQQKEQRSGGCR